MTEEYFSGPTKASRAAQVAQFGDATRALRSWRAPTPQQDAQRLRFLDFLAEHGPAAVGRALRVGHLTASAVLLDSSGSRVLLTLHALAGHWLQLGGHLEPVDTSLAAAAAREVAEESGIGDAVVDPIPLTLDWHVVTCRDPDGVPGPSAHLDTTFLAVAPPGAAHRISEESLDLRWFGVDALPVDADETVRRVVAAARLRTQQQTGR